ncbi:MAG: GGDEF domain-containing protein [Oscillibacter sp.]|nr:GGDEF domain-containing protein [Oscillibacter sp.]
MIGNYFLENWALILILLAFTVTLETTVFLDRKTVNRMLVLILSVFLLSIVVYAEFLPEDPGGGRALRLVFMAIRYSATPFIIAQVIYTAVKKFRPLIFIPAVILAVINLISIFTGVVFRIDGDGTFRRGPLGLLPYFVAGLYCVFLVYILFKRSNKTSVEIIPIAFLCFAFLSGLILPFVYGKAYSRIFCPTIAIALFVYYVFLILQLTKLDSLTGLLNRQAFYADIRGDPKDITALVSIDMNGLKAINDTDGHSFGDEALVTLAVCLTRALKSGQSGYRIGGDEFVIVCRKSSRNEVERLVGRIKNAVAATKYSCSVGYGYRSDETKSMDALLKESDEMMYEDKARYYTDTERDRRKHRTDAAESEAAE